MDLQSRKEIARYVLSRGITEADVEAPGPEGAEPEAPEGMLAARIPAIPFPADLAPHPAPISPVPASSDPLPKSDVVVITWTVDEGDALANVLTPGISRTRWHPYDRDFDSHYRPLIRGGAPSLYVNRLGSYMPTTIGQKNVLCMKSELHLNQDGKATGDGTATLPVKDFFKQIINEAKPKLFLTIGTAGSVTDAFGLGDVVVTRAARFWLGQEFRNEPFNGKTYKSEWQIPTGHFAKAEELMLAYAAQLTQPPVGRPSPQYGNQPPIDPPAAVIPKIRLDGRDMAAYHPILTTDWFEYGTTSNRLDQWGSGVEMGDAALGLACHELPTHQRPHWAVVRNMSDPVINGDLPTSEYHLNEQTTWAVGFYTAYGLYTSINGAITTWAIIAGLD